MGYLLIGLASLTVGGQFSLSKLYKNKVPGSDFSDLFYNFAMGLFSVILFAVVCLGNVGFTSFSFWLAAGVALCSTIYTLCSLKAVTYGKLAVFTTFLMLGGMIFPTIYGVLYLKEELSAFKIAGIVLLVCAMAFATTEKTKEKKSTVFFYVLCFIAFVCNGFVSIFSKAHQIGEGALNTFQFSFWQSVIVTVIVGIPLLINILRNRKKEDFVPLMKCCSGAKILGLIVITSFIMRVGSVMLLVAAKSVPASLLYPVTTGASILVTAIMGRLFFGEKISKINVISLCFDLVAVTLMIF